MGTTLKKYFSLLYILLIIIINAQGKSVEDYNIGKKINVSNNLNTGKLNLNIPLFSENLNDELLFKPSLNYRSEYSLSEPSSEGVGWDIDLLGKIVVAYKNPQYLHEAETIGYNDGFYSKNQNNCLLWPTTEVPKSNILSNLDTNLESHEPNIFYFNFLGNVGYFLQDNNGNFLVNCDTEVFKVIYEGSKCFSITSFINSYPEIILIDSKGNKFYFGGDYNSLDIYYANIKYDYHNSWLNDNGSPVSKKYFTNKRVNYISSFLLRKIELVNGKKVEAIFKKSNNSVFSSSMNGGYYINSDYTNAMPASNTTLINNNLYIGRGEGSEYASRSQYSDPTTGTFYKDETNVGIYQKLAVIDSIIIEDKANIILLYSQRGNAYTKPYLDKIELKDINNNIRKNIAFTYFDSDKRFLKNVKINDDEYGFEYNFDFSKNKNVLDSISNITYKGGSGGLLNKVIFPTKGTQNIEYEQNYVSKILMDTYYSEHETRELKNTNSSYSGQRVKSIINKDSFGDELKKNYSYVNDDESSSGILTFYSKNFSSSFDPNINAPIIKSHYIGDYDDYIRYSKVTENILNKGKTDYYFTDIISNPDSLSFKIYTNSPQYNNGNYINKRIPLHIRKDNERGKLFLERKYDKNNFLVFERRIKFGNFLNNVNPLLNLNNSCIDCKFSHYNYYIEKKQVGWGISNGQTIFVGFATFQPVLPYLPISITTKELTSDTSAYLETTQSFKYNDKYLFWHPHPIEEKTESLGKTNTIKTYYPGDILRKNSSCITGNCPSDNDLVGGKFSTYKTMADNNINSPVIIIQKNSSGKSSLVEYIYKKDNSSSNFFKPDKIRNSLLNSNYDLDSYDQAQVIDRTLYEFYDNKGNLLQSRNNNGIPTTTIWGYHQTQPIAKIEGVTYSEIMSLLGLDGNNLTSYLQLDIVQKSNSDVDNSSEQLIVNALDSFRKLLSNYLVTTYTYDPLIGITSITPPSGIRENYIYDSSNRLEKVVDLNNRILKEHKYNYVPTKYYNTEKSQTFTKNNCTSGYLGSSYTYTVPAGKYMSIVSQANADQMAQNDIDANGQTTANTNGTCYENHCTITAAYYLTIYYSSFQEVTTNHVKGILSLPITSGFDWTAGVNIGTLGATCRPQEWKEIQNISAENGSKWNIVIYDNGATILYLKSGSAPSSGQSITLYFEYDK